MYKNWKAVISLDTSHVIVDPEYVLKVKVVLHVPPVPAPSLSMTYKIFSYR